MSRLEIIGKINTVLADYFNTHKGETVKAKEMMEYFVRAGIFQSDVKGGLPIRKLLRELDAENRLDMIPYVRAKRKAVNTNWFFSDTTELTKDVTLENDQKVNSDLLDYSSKIKTRLVQPQKHEKKRVRDEDYIIDLCDEVLGKTASRQYRFDFLLGDTGIMLPTDAYYSDINLVIEYCERQHTESVRFWNKPTASGVPRDEQRTRYDQRRRDILPKHGIRLVEISFSDFPHDSHKRLLRNRDVDLEIVKRILSSH